MDWLSFTLMDALRCAQANALALGLGPSECEYRVLAATPCWRLRAYAGPATQIPLLIVASPIKRPYIWDLAPSVSAIRHCLRHHLPVYLLEWIPPVQEGANDGLDECTDAIVACAAKVAGEAQGTAPFLMGHSLGGTLAAVAAARDCERFRGLVLLGAPLCFPPAVSQFRDAVVAMDPSMLHETKVVPGSLLSQISTMASPQTFIWSRLIDRAISITDPEAMDIHARVERWTLDEAALHGKLVYQIFQWLYRENRLCGGTLPIRGQTIGPSGVRIPTLAVVNTADEIAPRASVAPFLDLRSGPHARLIEYPGETGVALQHLGVLIGRVAHARVWPEVFAWLRSEGMS